MGVNRELHELEASFCSYFLFLSISEQLGIREGEWNEESVTTAPSNWNIKTLLDLGVDGTHLYQTIHSAYFLQLSFRAICFFAGKQMFLG
jgi:hypothetical protein